MKTLDINKLEKFDILLVRFPGDETSLKIRQACQSNFSHAVIYLGNGSFIEGVEPVVSLFSYHRYYFKDLDDVQVLRLSDKFKNKLNSDETERFLRSLAYCNYSTRLLVFMNRRSINPKVLANFVSKKVWQDGIVCTSLITLPYYAGGIDISGNNEPYYSHFGDIEKFEGFVDVTETVFKDLPSGELTDDTFDYFTTFETGSLLEKQSEIVSTLNQFVQNKYRDITANPQNYIDINIDQDNLGFSTWEDIFPNIMRWFLSGTGKSIDNELSELIHTTGYNLLWFEEVHRHKYQYFPFYYISLGREIPAKQDLQFIRNSLQAVLDRHDVNEEAMFENFTLCPSKTFHLLLDMYRSFSDLLRSSIRQYDGIINEYDNLVRTVKARPINM